MIDLIKIREFGNIELLARQLVEGFITGMHKSPFHGYSVEFAEHRAYNAGESTRYIDWRVFAKTDRLFVKQFEEETNLRCYLLLDTSSSMFYPEQTNGKLVFSSMALACIAYLLQKQKDAIGLISFSNQIEIETPVKSTSGHIYSIFRHLETIMNLTNRGRKSAIVDMLHYVSEKIHRRSLVILFTDMFENMANKDSLFTALQHLKHNKHDVVIFHIHDKPTELDFDFEDRPYEFVDVETGEKLKLQANEVKESYTTGMQSFLNDLKLKCMQYRIELVEADINEGFDKILSTFLMKRR